MIDVQQAAEIAKQTGRKLIGGNPNTLAQPVKRVPSHKPKPVKVTKIDPKKK